MNVGVDGRVLCFPPRGIGRFLGHLVRAILKEDGAARFRLVADRPLHAAVSDLARHPRVRVLVLPIRRGYRWNLWQQAVLPAAAKAAGADILYCPANSLPWWQPVPVVVTVHDTKLLRAQCTLFGRGFSDGGRLLPRALRSAAAIVADSAFTRQDLSDRFGLPAHRIQVIYQGIGTEFHPLPDLERVQSEMQAKYGFSGAYLLALGAEAKDKNTAGLIEAFHIVGEKCGVKVHLVVAGIQDRALPAFRQLAQAHGIAPHLTILGYVDDEELIRLYNGAALFVYPQLDEGFGRPPLEAMACGTPVVASNQSSIPEVTGGAALLVDARDPVALASGLAVTLDRLSRNGQAELVASGLARAAEFSWERAAQDYLTLFRSVVEA